MGNIRAIKGARTRVRRLFRSNTEQLMLKLFYTSVVVLTALTGIANAQDADEMAKKGAAAYQLCAACHSLQPGVHLSGPSLANLWGKRAATISDFGRYTDALRKTDIVWDENTLYAWIADPQAMVPGTTMTFRGVENDRTRADLIAFLRLALSPGGAAKVVKDGMLPASMAQGQIPPEPLIARAEPAHR
jgi:cytochrome c